MVSFHVYEFIFLMLNLFNNVKSPTGMAGVIESICICLQSEEERNQKENSQNIDNGLKKQKVEMDKELKLLLLGKAAVCFFIISDYFAIILTA